MKPLRMEIFIGNYMNSNVEICLAGVYVYDNYNNKLIHKKEIECPSQQTEVLAYIMKKYIINKNLQWNKVKYEKDMLVLYGVDKRI